jgi:YegS/Rv2252/BmrU family lipid kinase
MTEFPARVPSPVSADPASSSASDRARRLLVIHNPVAGWRRVERFRRTVQQLERHGCAIRERATTGPGDAEAIAASAGEVDVVVVAGGDGTVNEALNGLMQRPGGALPLAVIPLGTANVLAGELGLPIDPEGAARAIAHGRIVTAHPGQARFDGRTRRFALMAGAGFDAQAVARVRTRVKRKLGKGAYVLAGLEAALGYRFPELTVSVDGTSYSCAQVVVCKGHYYAGRYVLAPDVRPWLPELHVVLFHRPGTFNAARYALGMQLDRLPAMPDVRVLPGIRSVRIDGPAGDPVQGDGDLVGHLPVEIELLPEAARFVVGDPP